MSTSLAIPQGSLILVTGANGLIGSHVVAEALKAGFRVRGTVRDAAKAQQVEAYFHAHFPPASFETALVPDILVPGAFNTALQGVSAVAHVASDVSMRSDPQLVITPLVNATTDFMRSAAAVSTVKRFVLTSSSAASNPPRPNERYTITRDMYNDAAVQQAWSNDPTDPNNAFVCYMASKTEQERAAWKFVAEEKPQFSLNVIQPACNIGPLLLPGQAGSTAGWTRGFARGEEQGRNMMLMFGAQRVVSPIDVALLHLAALTRKEVPGERILAYSEPYNYNDLVDVVKELQPENTAVGDKIESTDRDLSEVDVSREVELLKLVGKEGGFTGLKECVRQLLFESN